MMMMHLEMEKKEHSDGGSVVKVKQGPFILRSVGIFIFLLHPAPLSHFRP